MKKMKKTEQYEDFSPVEFSGIAQTAGIPGRNGNIYTVEGWERAIEVYRTDMIENRRSFGMMDHQYDFTLQNSAFIITDLFLNERNEVICEAVTIPTIRGIELGGLLDDPNVGQISVSTSIYVGSPTYDAEGNALYNEFRLESIDAVTDPSFTEAVMSPEDAEQRRRRRKPDYDYESYHESSLFPMSPEKGSKKSEGKNKEGLDLLLNFLAGSEEREKQAAQMSDISEKIGMMMDILQAAFPGEHDSADIGTDGSVSGGNMPDPDLMDVGAMFSKNKQDEPKLEEKQKEEEEQMELTKEKMTEELDKSGEAIVEKAELAELRKLKESVEAEKREKKLAESKVIFDDITAIIGEKEEVKSESFIKGEECSVAAMVAITGLKEALETSKKETEAARLEAVKVIGKSEADEIKDKSYEQLAYESAKKNKRKVPNKEDYAYAQSHKTNKEG